MNTVRDGTQQFLTATLTHKFLFTQTRMKLFILIFCFVTQIFADEDCSAGSNCISLPNCPEFMRKLQENQRQTFQEINNIRCGFEGTNPKICCPIQSASQKRPSSRPTEIDLSKGISPLLPKSDVCGVADIAQRIIGGQKADLGQFPWMALIEYKKGDKGSGFHCGGVLINEKYILTAAHCIVAKEIPKTWKAVRVRLGEVNTATEIDCIKDSDAEEQYCAEPPVNMAIKEIITHNEYDPNSRDQYNDIALIRLHRDVTFSEFIKPVCLPPPATPRITPYKSMYTTAGWGKTESRSESADLLYVQVGEVDQAKCQSTYKKLNVTLGPNQICAGGQKGKDSCRGDSGGPLMASFQKGADNIFYTLGIVSFGPTPCGTQGWPGVYTRVQNYIPWIYSQLKP